MILGCEEGYKMTVESIPSKVYVQLATRHLDYVIDMHNKSQRGFSVVTLSDSNVS